MSSDKVKRWIWDRDGVRGPNDEVPTENEFVLAADYDRDIKALRDEVARWHEFVRRLPAGTRVPEGYQDLVAVPLTEDR